MSSTASFLNSLLKIDLTEFAETSHLTDYAGLRKAELAEKLDDHLRRNATRYSKEPNLGEYYRRLGTTSSTARSPIKRIAEKVSDVIKPDDELTVTVPTTTKKSRRKTRLPSDEETDETDGPSASTSLLKTPAQDLMTRTSILASSNPFPPSPAVVTDAIDAQTRRIRTSISHAYERTQIEEYSDTLRETLSSTVTINVLAILLEALGLRTQLMSFKPVASIPPVQYLTTEPTKVYLPDLFVLLSTTFWAPFSLWILTTILLPATASYFINLPLAQLPSHSPARRTSMKSNPHIRFDPFVFNITKGLIAYLVFGLHFQFIELYKNVDIALVNTSVPGGYHGMLISSGIGAAVSLYEAILKRHH